MGPPLSFRHGMLLRKLCFFSFAVLLPWRCDEVGMVHWRNVTPIREPGIVSSSSNSAAVSDPNLNYSSNGGFDVCAGYHGVAVTLLGYMRVSAPTQSDGSLQKPKSPY